MNSINYYKIIFILSVQDITILNKYRNLINYFINKSIWEKLNYHPIFTLIILAIEVQYTDSKAIEWQSYYFILIIILLSIKNDS